MCLKRSMTRAGQAGLLAFAWLFAGAAGLMNNDQAVVNGQRFWAQNANRPWSLNLEGDSPCYRFELRSGDRWVMESAVQADVVERSELTAGAKSPLGAFNTPIWTAYEFNIEPGARTTSRWVVLGSWHVVPDADDTPKLSSSWQLELLTGDILAFDMRNSTEKPIRSNPSIHRIWISSKPLVRGVWHSIVSRAVFDWKPDGAGAIEVWIDGAKVADYKGPVGYNTAHPPYFKFGLYRDNAPETLVVRYADLDISLQSLAVHAPIEPPCARRQ